MHDGLFSTPVALLVYNRPQRTAKVFAKIREARPPRLLIVADGFKQSVAQDAEKCAETRAIVEQVDWPCQVDQNYADDNMGCKRRVSSGLDWVFQNVEEAIILEDDCLPHAHFFHYCQQLLERFRNDNRVMAIAGTNALGTWKTQQSYHFSYSGGVWGWASWRRAWVHYDVDMSQWQKPAVRELVRNIICDEEQFAWRERTFNMLIKKNVDTWDYQWLLARLLQSGLTAIPSVNLVANIGFGADATHTKTAESPLANIPTYPIKLPLGANPYVVVDRQYDRQLMDLATSASLRMRLANRIARIANRTN